MNKRRILVGIVGIALGFAIGFGGANYLNKKGQPSGAQSGQAGQGAAAGVDPSNPQAAMGPVQETIQRAKDHPEDFKAQMDAAGLYYQIQRMSDTANYLERAYNIDHKRAAEQQAPLFLGQYYADNNDLAQAIKWFRAQLEQNPDDPETLTDIGRAYLKLGNDPEKAISYLQAALKNKPDDTSALGYLAEVYIAKKDIRGAEDSLAKAASQDPKNEVVAEAQSQLNALKSGGSPSEPAK